MPTSGVPQTISGTVERDDANQSGTFEINAATTAVLGASLLVRGGGSLASVQVFLAGSQTAGCKARAVGVPTG
jgi:hypothetical protein